MLRNALQPWIRRILAAFWLLRLSRSLPVAAVTGVGALAAGASASAMLAAILGGWLLAVGSLSLELYTEREFDAAARRRRNPLAEGSLQPSTGLAISILFILGSLVVISRIPWAVVPWLASLAIVAAMARRLLEASLLRALALGLLLALYVILGGLAGQMSAAVWLLSGAYLFAGAGGCSAASVRDLRGAPTTPKPSLALCYGMACSAGWAAAGLVAAVALGLAVYATRLFGALYLYFALAAAALGLGMAGWLAARPSPRLAGALVPLGLACLGGLNALAVILGRL
ncbi:MAG: UbiA family prenyltransferase [Chloroflexota bacterium]